jgi:hypothetical protein
MSNVLSAAQTLSLALQQCKSSPPSPPDKDTAEIINAWLENYMPVSVVAFLLNVQVHRMYSLMASTNASI